MARAKKSTCNHGPTIKRLTNTILVLIAVFLIAYHHQGRQLADYEARFLALSIKAGQMHVETLRQKVDWLTVLTQHGIIDPLELETARNHYTRAVQTERTKQQNWRARYGY